MALDVSERRLSRDRQNVPLPPKAHDLLVQLVRNAGRLVTKRELLDQVWAGSFVEEGILSVHISALRKALGDDNRSPRFIETVSRSGYRFIAPVIDDERTRGGCSIAVLPARPRGTEMSDAERSVGLAIADALIDRLGRWTQILVRPTRAILTYADSQLDPTAIGRALGVDAVIVSSFEKTSERIRVFAELLRARDGVLSLERRVRRAARRWHLVSRCDGCFDRRAPRGNSGEGALRRCVWELGRPQARPLAAAASPGSL